ncbi:calbindin isoform X2 [Myotis yumanensis]|uniref:calbindin isoform X2 n=1 Tax=Myotis yumanensis TaxID=159337 RepID=UPI0038D3C346
MAESHLQSPLISASQFFEIWLHFDADGSGYLEGKELQSLVRELQQARKKAGLELSSEMKAFVEQYGQKDDGKIGIVETWRKYDTDHSGFIETEELKNFLKDLLEKANKAVDDAKLAEYTDLMLKLFDSNNDGKLELTEMARLLPVQENFLLKFQGVKMCGKEFNKAFELYDQDGNGYIDEHELDALLRDLCEKNKQDLDMNNIPNYKKSIMALSDGGKLYRTDLALILSAGDN